MDDRDIETIVFEALGAASTCWKPPPSDQVFDSSQAVVIGNELLAEVRTRIVGDRTDELIAKRNQLQAALRLGNDMMASMASSQGPADEDRWVAFELALADLVNGGHLDSEPSEATVGRDRLQADRDHLVEINAALRQRPDLAERAPLVVALAEEGKRLRTVVEAMRDYLRANEAFNSADGDDPQLTDKFDAMANGWTRVKVLLDQLDREPTTEENA